MAWTLAQEAPRKTTGTGPFVTVSVGFGGKVILTINAATQALLFGGPLAGKRLIVQVGRAEQEGKLRLAPGGDSGLPVGATMHGSARLLIRRWASHLPEHAKAATCDIRPDGDGYILTLPDWASAEAAKAALAAEFALKKGRE